MVKIRMMRMGSKKRPYYRLMAIDERKQRDGRPLQFLGTYDPSSNPASVKLDLDGIESWVGKGAQLSGTVRSLVKRARAGAGAASGAVSGTETATHG
jgi:small subunit ribosomal protein S16